MLSDGDNVFLGADGQSGQMADWDKVQAIAGDLMIPDETLYPPRFHVSDFPTRAQLELIGGEPLGAELGPSYEQKSYCAASKCMGMSFHSVIRFECRCCRLIL